MTMSTSLSLIHDATSMPSSCIFSNSGRTRDLMDARGAEGVLAFGQQQGGQQQHKTHQRLVPERLAPRLAHEGHVFVQHRISVFDRRRPRRGSDRLRRHGSRAKDGLQRIVVFERWSRRRFRADEQGAAGHGHHQALIRSFLWHTGIFEFRVNGRGRCLR